MSGVSEVAIDARRSLYVIEPGGAGFVATLPGRNRVRDGAQIVIVNTDATHAIEVNDADSTLIGTVAAQRAVRLSWRDLGAGSFAGIWTYTQLLTFTQGAALTSRAVRYEVTIESEASRVSVRELVDALGYDGTSIADVLLLIPIDVVVFSDDPSVAALRIGTFPATSLVTIVNSGEILGAGGAGGSGAGGGGLTGAFATYLNALPGGAGGVALANDAPGTVTVRVDNGAGAIKGGGGGGGGGGGTNNVALGYKAFGGGGGGGQSHVRSLGGGPVTPGRRGFVVAGDGGPSGGGAAGVGGVVVSANVISEGSDGGAGGGWGAAGNGGSDGAMTSAPFADGADGGAGGAAVTGNSGITWLATGTRVGAVT